MVVKTTKYLRCYYPENDKEEKVLLKTLPIATDEQGKEFYFMGIDEDSTQIENYLKNELTKEIAK